MLNRIKKPFVYFKNWMSYNPPGALSSKGWRLFEKEFSEKAPIRYYFYKDFKKTFVYPIKWKYRQVTEWIRYRTYDRYHIIDTGLPPNYYEIGKRMLYSNFNMLKDFVEVDQAIQSYWFSSDSEKIGWKMYIPFYKSVFYYQFRMPERGIAHLKWAATLDDPSLTVYDQSVDQAKTAREILALYDWWVNIRPARKLKDPGVYSDQGFSEFGCLDDDFDKNSPDYKLYREISTENDIIEATWDNEDTEMLVRLVKIRNRLWT